MRRYGILVAIFLVAILFFSGTILAQQGEPASLEMNVPAATQFTYDPFSGLSSSAELAVQISMVVGSSLNNDLANSSADDLADALSGNEPAEDPSVTPQVTQAATLLIVPADNRPSILSNGDLELPVELTILNQVVGTPTGFGFEFPVTVDSTQSPGVEINFSLNVPPSIYANPGVYSLELEVSLLDTTTREVVLSPKSMLISVSVLQKLQTNIAGTLGSYEDGVDFSVIDFEELETGESRQVFIQVRGNTEATITVSSENDGRMVNLENAEIFVDYSVNVDGVDSSLESPLHLDRSVAQDLQGSAYPMTVTIGDVERSFSGDYQDVITVDVTPQ